jgi:hypothetical protein
LPKKTTSEEEAPCSFAKEDNEQKNQDLSLARREKLKDPTLSNRRVVVVAEFATWRTLSA